MALLLTEVSKTEADLVGLLCAVVVLVGVMVAGLWLTRRGGD